MSSFVLMIALTFTALLSLLPLVLVAVFARRTPPRGEALIVVGPSGSRVLIDETALVLPGLHRTVSVDLTPFDVALTRDRIICRDFLRADVTATATFRLPSEPETIVRAAALLGHGAVNDPERRVALLQPQLDEALATVFAHVHLDDLLREPDAVRARVVAQLGAATAFRLDALRFAALEQTPLDQLDPDHLLDAQGLLTHLRRQRGGSR